MATAKPPSFASNHRPSFVLCALVILGGCPSAPAATTAPSTSAAGSETSAPAAPKGPTFDPRATLGGRLFDHWAKELGKDFVPDVKDSEALDGKGGPWDNGTLPGADGRPIVNTGHDYRPKRLFGHDLGGAEGIDGRNYRAQPYVLQPNLLTTIDEREAWITRLTHGEDAIPAYASVLSPEQIAALVDFMLAVRDGTAPHPDDILSLTSGDAHSYTLVAGDAERGHALFAERCASCHGGDGAKWLLDDGTHTVGTLARSAAYEVWLKILNGEPGSPMGPQVDPAAPRAERAADIRDLLAALCDRTRYPRGDASHEDVPDDDPRCGAALR